YIAGKVQYLAHLASGTAPAISDDIRRHCRAVFSVTLVNFLDDFFAPVATRKINVDIRPVIFTAFGQESFEERFKFKRIHRGNPEAKTNRAIRGATASLRHDVVLPAEFYDIPNDEKITG